MYLPDLRLGLVVNYSLLSTALELVPGTDLGFFEKGAIHSKNKLVKVTTKCSEGHAHY